MALAWTKEWMDAQQAACRADDHFNDDAVEELGGRDDPLTAGADGHRGGEAHAVAVGFRRGLIA